MLSREEILRKYKIANNINDGKFESNGSEIEYEDVQINVIEEAKVYEWSRLYLSDEYNDIEKGDKVTITYTESGETYDLVFASYNKTGLTKNADGVIDYTGEDDKKVLCLMVDIKEVENKQDIPLIRTLFRGSKYYTHNLLRRTDLTFTHNGNILEYYSVDF